MIAAISTSPTPPALSASALWRSGTISAVSALQQVPEIGLRPISVATHGPQARFRDVLFIEKEGFIAAIQERGAF